MGPCGIEFLGFGEAFGSEGVLCMSQELESEEKILWMTATMTQALKSFRTEEEA